MFRKKQTEDAGSLADMVDERRAKESWVSFRKMFQLWFAEFEVEQMKTS